MGQRRAFRSAHLASSNSHDSLEASDSIPVDSIRSERSSLEIAFHYSRSL